MKLFKNIAITLIAFSLSCTMIHAQATWTKVTDINQISDDGIYLLSALKTTSTSNTGDLYLFDRNPQNTATDLTCNANLLQGSVKKSMLDNITTTSISKYLILKIEKKDTKYSIQNLYDKRYFSCPKYFMMNSVNTNSYDLWSMTINADYKAIITTSDGKYNIRLSNTGDPYRLFLYAISNSDAIYPTLYKLDHTTLSATTDYTEDVELSGVNVTFSRAFADNVYNSIILPFGVENYKGVFGANVDAYVISDCTDGKINFNKSANNYLEANTPYLLYGAFSAGPYNFDNVTMQKASEAKNMTSSVYTFTGNYTKQNLGTKTGYYIINNNKLYDCGKLTALNITPHLCFITSSSNNNGTAKMSFDGIVSTGIDNISNGEKADGDIYNLSGIKSKTEKGFYIKSGKIHFKK